MGPESLTRSTVFAVVLTAFLVVGGCSALPFGGKQTTTRTLTPAAVPTDAPTETPVPQLAPGVHATGLEDPDALVNAHAAHLERTSYTVRTSNVERYANGSIRRRTATDAQFAANGSRYFLRIERTIPSASGLTTERTAIWSSGERGYRAVSRDGTTTYGLISDPEPRPIAPRNQPPFDRASKSNLQTLFGGATATDVERIDGGSNGEPARYRVTATQFSRPGIPSIRFVTYVSEVAFEAVIDSHGIVHEYRLSYTGLVDGQVVRGTESARYTAIGSTTVERPAWYGAALNNTTRTPLDGRHAVGIYY